MIKSNSFKSILRSWYDKRHQTQWVLGTIYKTEGSSYRKAGAMMLINGYGEQLGLLSGGCLEADIKANAKKAMHRGKSMTLIYDNLDEDDISYKMQTGCGGKVFIMLQPVTSDIEVALSMMLEQLELRESGVIYQRIPTAHGETEGYFISDEKLNDNSAHIKEKDGAQWLVTPIHPEPHLLIIGGGIDAIPLSQLAKNIGWQVSLCDPRPAQGRSEHFPHVDLFLNEMGNTLEEYARTSKVHACVIMSHNISIDAQALNALRFVPLHHMAILGPSHRYELVMEVAHLGDHDLPCPISSPAGLDLGGELPESIALSILAECHARLHQKMGLKIGQMVA